MIQSPCIKVCKYDTDFLCIGCRRSRQEISAWSTASDEQKKKILKNIEDRRKEDNNFLNNYV